MKAKPPTFVIFVNEEEHALLLPAFLRNQITRPLSERRNPSDRKKNGNKMIKRKLTDLLFFVEDTQSVNLEFVIKC